MKSFKSYITETVDLNSTLSFIKTAHEGQKYGNKPYWTHPVAVCETGKKIFGSSFTKEEFIKQLASFSQSLDEKAVSKNRDERCKCLHRVHLSEYVDDDFFSVGKSNE